MNQIPGKLFLNVNSTVFMVPYGATTLDFTAAPTAMVTTNLSTALTGSTVLTAPVATVAEMNKCNAKVMEIQAVLVALGLMTT